MRHKFLYIFLLTVAGITGDSCQKLDIPPINILTADDIFAGEPGINAYLASMYNAVPWEDFDTYAFQFALSNNTDEAVSSLEGARSTLSEGQFPDELWWRYDHIRNVNDFLEKIPESPINESLKATLVGEAKFLRAMYYFAMVKRYGGVPIVKEVQTFTGDNLEELQIPRNKEVEVYDFIATDLDEAAAALPTTNVKGRATKYAALALKSRAMLYAASSAKYSTVMLDGIVGIPASEANRFWQASMDAANAIIMSSAYSLYEKNADKVLNYQQLFIDEDNPEAIFSKYYVYPAKGHGYDVWALPFGIRSPEGYGSGINPTLQLVEQFENIDGTSGPLDIGTPGSPVYYDHPLDLFANKDPRLLATVIVPFSTFRGTTIDVQAGLYDLGNKYEAGNYDALYNVNTHQPDNVNGTLHIVGLNGLGGSEKTQTGFYVRKYLNFNLDQALAKTGQITTPWIVFRYAEVLLNYAEAAVELGNIPEAKDKVNLVRARGGIALLDDADVTVDRVRHERLVELAFENHRWWDYRRWRIADDVLNNTWPMGLKPYYDVTQDAYRFEKSNVGPYTKTFTPNLYLKAVPAAELAKNPKLVQNPNY